MRSLPSPQDMDKGERGQFLQHWEKSHHHPGHFEDTSKTFTDDSTPLWDAIRVFHDRIHAGEAIGFPVPTDHKHEEENLL